MGPEALFPTIVYYVVALAIVGIVIGIIVGRMAMLFGVVAAVGLIAGLANGFFAPPAHNLLASFVGGSVVFVIVAVFAVITNLTKRAIRGAGKHTEQSGR